MRLPLMIEKVDFLGWMTWLRLVGDENYHLDPTQSSPSGQKYPNLAQMGVKIGENFFLKFNDGL